MLFTLVIMAGPDFPKPELSDSLENSIFFCTFAGFGVAGNTTYKAALRSTAPFPAYFLVPLLDEGG